MKIRDGFILTNVGDGFVAVPVYPTSETVHGLVRLNETGAFIWRGLADGKTVEEIAEQMCREYTGVDDETAKKAVQSLVEKLANDGLLEE